MFAVSDLPYISTHPVMTAQGNLQLQLLFLESEFSVIPLAQIPEPPNLPNTQNSGPHLPKIAGADEDLSVNSYSLLLDPSKCQSHDQKDFSIIITVMTACDIYLNVTSSKSKLTGLALLYHLAKLNRQLDYKLGLLFLPFSKKLS